MKTVSTPNAPAAIGPYSQGRIIGNILYTAGQIALVPGTTDLVGPSIEAQTEQVIKNLSAILQAAGTDWTRVAKTTVFLADMGDFAVVNGIYEKLLGGAKPARSAVQVAALPKGARIEIELVAEV
jgi:2-iminobutanoate/2-iminopropanoate deaminase